MRRIYEGFGILLRYATEGDFSAERDELFADGPPPSGMAFDDAKRLDELQWRWDAEYGRWRIAI